MGLGLFMVYGLNPTNQPITHIDILQN